MRGTGLAFQESAGSEGRNEEDVVLAEVNGEKITFGRVFEELILTFGSQVVEKLVNEALVNLELQKHEITITEEDIDREIEEYLKVQGRGKTLEQVLKESNYTLGDFREKIKQEMVVPKKIIIKEGKVKEGEPIDPIYIAIWINGLQQNHTVKTLQYNKEDLEEGVLAQVDDIRIGRSEVLDVIVKTANIVNYKYILDSLIETILVEQEFRKKKIEVDTEEIEKKIEEEKKLYPMYEQFLALLGSNIPLKKREMFINEGIDKIISHEPTEEELKEHYERYKDYFCRKLVRASHLLVKAIDPFTGDPLQPKAFEEALEKISKIKAELKAGASFNSLIMKYSEDEFTKKLTDFSQESDVQVAGDLGMFPMKKGKRVNQKIADVAFQLEVGEVSGPIKTEFGYHLIKVTQIHPPEVVPYEEIKEEVKKRVIEDFKEDRRLAWLEELKKKAVITKDLSYLYKKVKARGQ